MQNPSMGVTSTKIYPGDLIALDKGTLVFFDDELYGHNMVEDALFFCVGCEEIKLYSGKLYTKFTLLELGKDRILCTYQIIDCERGDDI